MRRIFVAFETYLFIDGAYFRRVADEYMQQLFGVPAEINYGALRRGGPIIRRVFYYDCLNDIQKDGESQADFEARVHAQQATFDAIQSLDGFHVRLGSLSGSRRKLRQKKVDVLLAVEALDHAFRKNMDQICLIAGDLDFAPLVDSLIRLGTYVQIMYQARSASRELYSAADIGRPISVNDIHGWTTDKFQKQHPIPHCTGGGGPPALGRPIRTGIARSSDVELYKRGDMFCLYIPMWDQQSLHAELPDLAVLEKYFAMVYAPIEWK
jgi:uncharacterized LabA/DUF88 family protein